MNNKPTSLSFSRWLLLSCFTIGATVAEARQLSQDEALQRAMDAMRPSVVLHRAPAVSQGSIKLAHTAVNPHQLGQQYFYVFNINDNDGFLIAGADDKVAPVLGYSDSGTVDMNNLPPNLKWWLSEYERQIQWMYDHPADYSSAYKAPSRATAASIEPIVKAKWNQYAPYNNLCPMDGDNRSLTGCVATAMAQIMHHHRWPATGKGETSYSCGSLGTVSATFEGTVYDWDNMSDEYLVDAQWDNDGNYTPIPKYSEAQANAVATLMYHCGVGAHMYYSASGSGASDWDAEAAFVDYFSYDPETINIYSPTDFGYEETCEKLIAELRADRPVYFAGQSPTGGHAFVLDGWNSEGKAHINWGWGGYCDGYFLITALNPDGGKTGYNDYQTFICGIQPPGGSAVAPYPEFWSEGNFTCFTADDGTTHFKGDEGIMYNKSKSTHNFTFTLSFENIQSGEVKYMNPQGPVEFESGYGFYDLGDGFYNAGIVTDGTYKVRLVYKVNDADEWHNVRFVPYDESRQFIYAVVRDSAVTYSNEAPEVEPTEATILVSDWEYAPIMNPNNLNPISFTITNTSDNLTFDQTLLVSFYQRESSINWYFEEVPVKLQPRESRKYDIVFGDDPLDKQQKNGEFELCLINEDEKLFSDRLPVTINSEYTENDPAFEGSELNYNILSEEDATCEVTYGDDYPSEVIIPEKTIINEKEYTVIGIGSGAFEYRSAYQTEVKSIYIPKTITQVETFYTFPGYLEKFEVSEENTKFSAVDGVFFNKDQSVLLVFPASNLINGTYTVPEGVKTLSANAFLNARLSYVNLPVSLRKIEQGAFEWSKLKSVYISNPNLEIARYAFRGMSECESFDIETSNYTSKDGVLYSKDMTKLIQYSCGAKASSFTMPEGVKIISEYSFEDALNLTEINLPESLEEIKSSAFASMYHLENVFIPDRVKIIWSNAFWRCPAIKSITIGKSVEKIYSQAFINSDPGAQNQPNENLTEVISLNPVPPTLEWSIYTNNYAFHPTDCENVPLYVPYGCKEAYAAADGWKQFATIIELPKEDEENDPAFEGSELNYKILSEEDATCEVTRSDYEGDIIIPEKTKIDGKVYTVTGIGKEAFRESKITTLYIPKTITQISDNNVFYNCPTIARISVDSESNYFTAFDGVLFDKGMTKLLQYPLGAKTTSFTVPEGVKIIVEDAFTDANYLLEVNLPESLTRIKSFAFANMQNLEKIIIPNNVQIIENDAFSGCPAIKSITIGKSVEKIYSGAFLSSRVDQQHQPNENLTEVISLNPVPPTIIGGISVTGNNAFHPTDCENVPLYVPYGCKEAYAAADGWKQFATIIELPKEDESDIFRPLDNSTCEMTGLPDDFNGELVIPSTAVIDGVEYDVTAIAAEAFKNCTDITSVVIGDNITTVGKDAFAGCTGITSITIGNRTIHFGRAASDSTIAIEDGAFAGCEAVTTVTCWYEVPPVISDDTFTDAVYRNAELIVPHAEPYSEATGWRNFRTMTSGIDGVNGDEVKIKVDGGSINIEDAGDATIEVFNMSGALIYSGTEPKIDNLTAGLYIVRIGSYSTKVVVK